MLYIVVVIYCLISRMYLAHIQLNRKLQHVGFVTYPPPKKMKILRSTSTAQLELGELIIHQTLGFSLLCIFISKHKTAKQPMIYDLDIQILDVEEKNPTSTFIFLREILNCKQNDVVRQRNAAINCFKPPAFKFRTNNQCGNIFGWGMCNAAWNIFWSNKAICTFTLMLFYPISLLQIRGKLYKLGSYFKNHETSL